MTQKDLNGCCNRSCSYSVNTTDSSSYIKTTVIHILYRRFGLKAGNVYPVVAETVNALSTVFTLCLKCSSACCLVTPQQGFFTQAFLSLTWDDDISFITHIQTVPSSTGKHLFLDIGQVTQGAFHLDPRRGLITVEPHVEDNQWYCIQYIFILHRKSSKDRK